MLYTGVDIIEIARIEQAITRWADRFIARVFTVSERAESGDQIHSLAARWAAKEAAAKALGIGVAGLGAHAVVGVGIAARWHDLEVRRLPRERPQLVLHGIAQTRAAALGWRSVAISLSHGRDYAVAFVVAQADQP
ncbi:MAG: holo-ACP synthase [Chloroflexota bacterium]|nr:holo-ACP synthase [Chloroflexota bacterium]PLS79920.1 MAG: holo-[acyl-carrier-protein] synthase [Chloroflexota bacterium]